MKYNLTILFLIFNFLCFAQDIHFTQFYSSPLTLNPALTGCFDGDFRLTNNIRNQWKAIPVPYNTITLGGEKNFIRDNKQFGLGLIGIHDRSAGLLIVNKFYTSVSFPIKLGFSELHLGLQMGFVMKSYPLDELTFPDQFDMTTGYFNAALNNNESNLDQNLIYPDVNSGLAWTVKQRRIEVIAGISFFHITKPRETFLPGNNRLPVRSVAHAGGKFFASSKFFIWPNFIFMQHDKANLLMGGTNFGFMLPGNHLNANYIFVGSQFRDGVKRNYDAVALIAGLKFINLEIGVSYDFNLSALKEATKNRGAFEISLIYITGQGQLKNRTIPCERL